MENGSVIITIPWRRLLFTAGGAILIVIGAFWAIVEFRIDTWGTSIADNMSGLRAATDSEDQAIRSELSDESRALRTEVAGLRTDLKSGIQALRIEIKTQFGTLGETVTKSNDRLRADLVAQMEKSDELVFKQMQGNQAWLARLDKRLSDMMYMLAQNIPQKKVPPDPEDMPLIPQNFTPEEIEKLYLTHGQDTGAFSTTIGPFMGGNMGTKFPGWQNLEKEDFVLVPGIPNLYIDSSGTYIYANQSGDFVSYEFPKYLYSFGMESWDKGPPGAPE